MRWPRAREGRDGSARDLSEAVAAMMVEEQIPTLKHPMAFVVRINTHHSPSIRAEPMQFRVSLRERVT
jgi:hypothetical protein